MARARKLFAVIRHPTHKGGLRADIVEIARRMSASGLSHGRSGNVSARWGDGMLITPSGAAYETLEPDDIVYVDADGTPRGGKPSSEWRFHQAAYQARPDASAIVHCHSRCATALACARRPIPAFHYMVAVAGGTDIPVAAYATFGTEELAAHAAEALSARKACLLANHGQIAAASDLDAALELAGEVENLAAQYLEVLKLGEVHLLDDAQMAEVLAKFETYGKPD
ncbi:class II aldolase/adducin family protein [Dichotomicrobium thermohalophilum]|uniref:L-fuculose 1-phosphate aldolase n=1 Tax=Dichotomicrobium thermohalophilum TaxID=933063 RepID=A0A397Q5L5_9HYPH|nr:class II aldolase/adducin family protein [Dichotomicrobium thermohalophilum]RIA56243.1 L-fuculose 1-phosphate aldolase [Dichotomicrobium thermohalophilum]